MNSTSPVFVLVFWLICGSVFGNEVSFTVSPQLDYFPSYSKGTNQYGRSLEVKVDGYYDITDNYRTVIELIGRLDADDSGRRIVEFRQLYAQRSFEKFDIFLGNRQAFWGTAESKNVVDIINQKDLAANQGNEAKLGSPSLSIEAYTSFGDLQIWYIPNFREITANDVDAHPSGGLPFEPAKYERRGGKNADDFAARFSMTSGDWDLAGSIFSGTAREPIIQLGESGKSLKPTYLAQNSLGLEAQYTGEATLLKWESIHGKQSGDAFDSAVAGLEYTYYGIFDRVWDIGLIGEVQYDTRAQAAAKMMYSGGMRLTLNDTKDTNLLAIMTIDEDSDQSLIAFEGARRITDWSSLEVSGRFFDAKTSTSTFGQFSNDDNIRLSMNIFF